MEIPLKDYQHDLKSNLETYIKPKMKDKNKIQVSWNHVGPKVNGIKLSLEGMDLNQAMIEFIPCQE